MEAIKNLLIALHNDEDGAGATEYIILLILILVVISLFKMVSTLDNIDTRLHNIEIILNLS